jgi:hypothetical protein
MRTYWEMMKNAGIMWLYFHANARKLLLFPWHVAPFITGSLDPIMTGTGSIPHYPLSNLEDLEVEIPL